MSVSLTLRSLQRAWVGSSTRVPLAGSRALHATSRRSEQYPNADLVTFNKVVGTQDRIVLVDFYADWCGPCRQLSPILEKISTDSSIKSGSGLPIDVLKIDTENEQVLPLAQQYKVRALPTVVAFRNGEAVGNFVGMLGEDGVKRFLQTV
ncbi:hypothetical protein C0993_011915 [Termitomyces sp. T159_Od127]|nr:hypothetical protein C0993_011915 [Termitomyces sp. T159_Od127]